MPTDERVQIPSNAVPSKERTKDWDLLHAYTAAPRYWDSVEPFMWDCMIAGSLLEASDQWLVVHTNRWARERWQCKSPVGLLGGTARPVRAGILAPTAGLAEIVL
jgi:hypothetical protein